MWVQTENVNMNPDVGWSSRLMCQNAFTWNATGLWLFLGFCYVYDYAHVLHRHPPSSGQGL